MNGRIKRIMIVAVARKLASVEFDTPVGCVGRVGCVVRRPHRRSALANLPPEMSPILPHDRPCKQHLGKPDRSCRI